MEERYYETTFLITSHSTEEIGEMVNDYLAFLEEEGARIIHKQYPLQAKLAYPIQNKTSGTYQGIEFRANPNLVDKLKTKYNRDERIQRFLTVCLDKHAIKYKEQQRKEQKAPTDN